jgi:iron complex outermembrane receptor protein
MDPVIRGQSQTRLNVLLDGAYVHGGCPNRMDPPTSYSALDSYDRVTVLKGFQSVVHGGGGSGGTLLLERTPPRHDPQKPVSGRLKGGYKSNSDSKSLHAEGIASARGGFLRGFAGYQDAGNYQDGAGEIVRSAYSARELGLIAGWRPDEDSLLQASIEDTQDDDVWFAGAGMDAPESSNRSYRISYNRKNIGTIVREVGLKAYRSDVEHLMDNYSLRQLTSPMKMKVPSTSDTRGGRLTINLRDDRSWDWQLGLDTQQNNRNALRYAGPAAQPDPKMLNSILWPDVDLDQYGLFVETSLPLGASALVRTGLRYDRVEVSAGSTRKEAAPIAGIATPAQLYQAYYGSSPDDQREDNLSGFLRYEQGFGEDDSYWFASLARSVRTADASERFLAANAMPDATGNFPSRWVGNPNLDPERHLQLEFGAQFAAQRHSIGANLFYDWVSDYILRDRAHGQDGILRDDNASIYRNVDARLWGAEADASLLLTDHWTLRAGLAYVQASNRSDHRWIAQTPPLEGSLGLEYQASDWRAGASLRFASRQTHVDDDSGTGSGLDVGETAGWGALDLYGRKRVGKNLQVDLGVDNLFDKTYAYHVNRANSDPFSPEALRVNEPGRSIWLKLELEL